jgi:CubicO group peptidase (beta-lactamase class C family)
MSRTGGFSERETAAIDRAAEAARRAWSAPGLAVAVVRDGEALLRVFGLRDLGGAEPVTPDTVFALASVSKAFTTTAIAMLVDEKKLAWDEPVRTYLPWFRLRDPAADACVTLRDLVCHRSGMPRHDTLWYAQDWTREETVRRYCAAPHSTSFRSTYEYANIPFMAAALALEAVTGKSWEQFVQQRIFRPLGMKTACIDVRAAQKLPDHASPHEKYRGKHAVLPWLDMCAEAPCGGIIASASDMSRWMEFQLGEGEFRGKRLISKEAFLETHKPCVVIPAENPDKHGFDFGVNISSYCPGWNLHDYRGLTVLDHGGLIDGFTSAATLVKREGLAVAVLCNLSGGTVVHAATRGIVDALLGLPGWNWPKLFKARARAEREEERKKKAEERAKNPRLRGTRPSLPLEAYAGDYDDAAYGRFSVALQDGRLVFTYGLVKLPMKHYHLDTFSFKKDEPGWVSEGKAQFLLNPAGQVTGLRAEGMINCEFRRVAEAK